MSNFVKLLEDFGKEFSPIEESRKHNLRNLCFDTIRKAEKIIQNNNVLFEDLLLICPSYYLKDDDGLKNIDEDGGVVIYLKEDNYLVNVLKHIYTFYATGATGISELFINEEVKGERMIIANNWYRIDNKKKKSVDNKNFGIGYSSGSFDITNIDDVFKLNSGFNDNTDFEVSEFSTKHLIQKTHRYKVVKEQIIKDEKLNELIKGSFDVAVRIHIPLCLNDDYHIYYLFSNTKTIDGGKGDNEESTIGYGGMFLIFNQKPTEDILSFFQVISNDISLAVALYTYRKKLLFSQTLSAIKSILIDSYAHNISSHSLSFLQRLFAYRNETYLKKPYSLQQFNKIENLPLNKLSYYDLFSVNLANRYDNTSELKHYKALGQSDQSNTIYDSTLLEYMLYGKKDQWGKDILYATDLLKYSEGEGKIPMPLDYAIAPLLSYLRDRGGFWSGIIRDNKATPSSIVSIYDLLMEMCNNPLFIGTIMAAEEFFIVHTYVHIKDSSDKKDCHLLSINLKEFVEAEMLKTSKDNLVEENDEKVIDNEDKGSLNKESQCNYSFVESNYTNLNFIRLGAQHEVLRVNLKDIKVLLPGGLVGKQAFFTIVENTLRNAKHINKEDRDDIKQNGLELHFQIKEKSFDDKKGNELYEIGIFLNYCTETKKKLTDQPKKKEKALLEGVITNSFEPILSDDGKPKMGGSSQDKICAALLFNTTFSAVEYYNKGAESYYPWMFYNLCHNNLKKHEIHSIYNKQSKEDKSQAIQKRVKKLNNEYERMSYYSKNLYVKFFHLWSANDVQTIDDTSSSQQNKFVNSIPRYKIGIIKGDDKKDIFIEKRKQGVVRLIKEDAITVSTDFALCYKFWNRQWLGKVMLEIVKGGEIVRELCNYDKSREEATILVSLPIDHDEGAEKPDVCKLRTHGNFLKHLCGGITLGELKDETIDYEKKQEILETVFTNITIVDKRLYNLLDNYRFDDGGELKKDRVLKDNLFLNVFDENKDTYGKVQKLYKEGKRHFYIFHLSYIDDEIKKLELEGTTNKYEAFIDNLFVLDKSNDDDLPSNCIFAVTTGRGRDEWLSQTDRHRANCMHIPIEALQTAIQQGVMFKDDFDIKYNLCKVLFGS